jgi:hypothetical protein
MRFIKQLAPLLEASPNEAHVVSVYAGSFEEVKAGQEPPVGQPSPEEYGVTSVRVKATFMKNFMFEELAIKHAGKISFTHIYPGLVDGPGFLDAGNPQWFRILWQTLYPFLWLTYMTSSTVCGEVMAYLATPSFPAKNSTSASNAEVAVGTDGVKGSGAYAVGQRADAPHPAGKKSFPTFQDQDLRKKVWDHTTTMFERVEKENATR